MNNIGKQNYYQNTKYAISLGIVSVWKLHWFVGYMKICIGLLLYTLMFDILLDFIYYLINMIVNVMKFIFSMIIVSFYIIEVIIDFEIILCIWGFRFTGLNFLSINTFNYAYEKGPSIIFQLYELIYFLYISYFVLLVRISLTKISYESVARLGNFFIR